MDALRGLAGARSRCDNKRNDLMGSKRPAPATAAAAAAAPGAVCVRSTPKRHAVCPAAMKRPKRPTGSPTTAGSMAPAQLGNLKREGRADRTQSWWAAVLAAALYGPYAASICDALLTLLPIGVFPVTLALLQVAEAGCCCNRGITIFAGMCTAAGRPGMRVNQRWFGEWRRGRCQHRPSSPAARSRVH